MNIDDPRHGTHAGYIAHGRAGTEVCDDCRLAQYRSNKRTHLRLSRGVRNRIPLGDAAWRKLDAATRTQMWHATNINRNMLTRLHKGGPDAVVLRETRDQILNAVIDHTPIGVARRLQALAAIGYSSAYLAPLLDTHESTLNRLRQRTPSFVRYDFAQRILNAYTELHMSPAPRSKSASITKGIARGQGWAPPLAWSDIDLDERPDGMTYRYRAPIEHGSPRGYDQHRARGVKMCAPCSAAHSADVMERRNNKGTKEAA